MSSTSRAMAVPEASPRPDSSAPQSSMSPSASGLVSAESPRRSSVRPRSEMVVSRSEKKALAIGAFVSGLCGAGILHGIWAEADHNQAGDFGKFTGGVRLQNAVMPGKGRLGNEAAAPYTVIASAAKQSRIPPRWQPGLLRCARNDEVQLPLPRKLRRGSSRHLT